MNIKKFFSFGRSKSENGIKVKKVNRKSRVANMEMAAGNLSAASSDLERVMAQQNMTTKILAVQDGEHSTALIDYAVKMAQKLDCEIIALDVSAEPMSFSGERKEREISRFRQRAQRNAETIQLKADAVGVSCKHVVQVGNQEETIKKLSQNDKSIRYVLIKPAQEQTIANQKRPRVPVVDLNCSSL